LDQVAARVVEYGCRHRARLDRLLGEPDTETAKSLELVPNVVDGERGERMASSTNACLNGFAAGCVSGSRVLRSDGLESSLVSETQTSRGN
jgi:hypothetical protein